MRGKYLLRLHLNRIKYGDFFNIFIFYNNNIYHMLYIITETLLNSGIFTWNKRFSEILEKCNRKYLFITKNDIINNKYIIKNSIIIFNNVKSNKIMNDNILYKLSNINKLYFVIHGDICQLINYLFNTSIIFME